MNRKTIELIPIMWCWACLALTLFITSCSPPPPQPGTPQPGETKIQGILESADLTVVGDWQHDEQYVTLTFKDGTTYHGKLGYRNQCIFVIGQHNTITINKYNGRITKSEITPQE